MLQNFQAALNDKKNTIFTESERKAYLDFQERIRRMTAESLRHRPVAYSVNEVAPPAVLEIAPTHIRSGELAAKGDRVEPGFLRCVVGKEENAAIPSAAATAPRRHELNQVGRP